MSEQAKVNLENCDCHDVLRFEDEVCTPANLETYLHDFFHNYSHQLTNELKSKLKISNTVNEWFEEGRECEILKPGQAWKKGKVKVNLTISFCPDEPEEFEENGHQEVDNITESPLDEIRQQLTDEN
jgi:hypothetical protein